MNTNLFIHWYDNIFIPEVKKYHASKKLNGKVLLIVDNAPCHPSYEMLERENGWFKILFLTPNITALVRPMDQGVVASFKREYRKQFLRPLLLNDDNKCGTENFFKKFNIYDCCQLIADCWNKILSTILQNA